MSPTSTYRSVFSKRLLKKKELFGVVIIISSFVIAVFAYFISTDGSPYANRIIPEIANRKPGSAILLLQLKKENRLITRSNFFEKLLNGEEDQYFFIPIISYRIKADSLIAQKYIDESVTERISIPLSKAAKQPLMQQRFLLGTDKFGRDIASRLIVGTRVSLGVGLIAVAISLTIGIFLGAIAGYFKGWIDDVVMWLINIIWSIPTLLLVFAVTLLLGKGFWQVFIAVGLTMWVNIARLLYADRY